MKAEVEDPRGRKPMAEWTPEEWDFVKKAQVAKWRARRRPEELVVHSMKCNYLYAAVGTAPADRSPCSCGAIDLVEAIRAREEEG